MKPSSVIILTYRDANGEPRLPHIEHLRRSNPEVSIYICIDEEQDPPQSKEYHWKNSDKVLRNFWKANGIGILSPVTAVIQWDTLVTGQLPDLPWQLDLASAKIIYEDMSMRGRWEPKRMSDPTWQDKNWWWWSEVMKMNAQSREPAVGLISFGCFIIRRHVWDAICNPQWDAVYGLSIQDELRFPTCAAWSNFRVGTVHLPHVFFHPTEARPEPGIYHGVKDPYPLQP